MANTVAELNTLADEAVAAIGAGDHATALSKLLQASARMNLMPDGELVGLSNLTFDRESLNGLIAQVRREAAASKGIQFSKLVVSPPGCGCDICGSCDDV